MILFRLNGIGMRNKLFQAQGQPLRAVDLPNPASKPNSNTDHYAVSAAMLAQRDRDLPQRTILGALGYPVGWLMVFGTNLAQYSRPVLVYATGLVLFLLALMRIFLSQRQVVLYAANPQRRYMLFRANILVW